MNSITSPSENTGPPRRRAPRARLVPSPETAEEAKLFRRVAQGDREALGVLYDQYAKPLYAFAIHMLNDPREAEQVLEEVFLGIWERGPAFDETVGKPSSWAVTMTRDQAMDRLRARLRRLDQGGRGLAGPARAAANEMPAEQRRSIELAFFGGRISDADIGAALQEPLGTIRIHVRRDERDIGWAKAILYPAGGRKSGKRRSLRKPGPEEALRTRWAREK